MNKVIQSILATGLILTTVNLQADVMSKADCQSTIKQTRANFETLKQHVEDSYASDHITDTRYRQMKKQVRDAKEKFIEASCVSAKTDKDRAMFRCLNKNEGDIKKCNRRQMQVKL